jgi:hypothetical protein
MLHENPYLIRVFRVLLNTNLHPENTLTELGLNMLAIYVKVNILLFSPPKGFKPLGGLFKRV